LIRGWIRAERTEIQQGHPELDTIAAEIADLEALIEARPARASTLRPLVEELRTKQANLQRANVRKIQSLKGAEIPAEEAYKAAVTELATTLEGTNLEAARCALRGLVGSIPVFQQDGKIYGRIGLNAAPLFRGSNPNFIERHGSGGAICAVPTIPQSVRIK
jgi:hypothetical protein